MSNKNIKIGIPIWETSKNVLGVTKSYLVFIKRFGTPVLLDPNHELRTDLDCIVIPGGADVDTKRYGQSPDYMTGKPDIYKEWFDFEYLQQYIDLEIPIFAICRGMQSLWVHFGGALHQDMMMDLGIWDHPTNKSDEPGKVMHKASVANHLMEYNSNKSEIGVNSRHHQVVDHVTKPECLEVISMDKAHNTVEGFVHKTLPIVAWQHHPEDCHNKLTYKMMELLVSKGEVFSSKK